MLSKYQYIPGSWGKLVACVPDVGVPKHVVRAGISQVHQIIDRRPGLQ